jgi:ammonium transporter, Amt family
MSTPLRILIVEDSADDADLLVRQLSNWHEIEWERVDSAPTMDAALSRGHWDAIVSDYSLPQFTGLAALQLLHDKQLDLPFILVSGCMGEDTAVAAMKAGAHDYILKSNLIRLAPAIDREMTEAAGRRARREAEDELYRAREELSIRVEERTAELSEANRALHSEIAERERAQASLSEAKAAAEHANRAKSEFVANMSHEIRTPLNGLIGTLDLLQSTELTQQQQRYTNMARTSAESLTTLLNDVLDFSKIEAGKFDIRSEDFDLYVIIEDAIELLAQRATRKKLDLLCHFAPEVLRNVRGDSDRIRQIVVNLVSNAIKFTETGSVTIRVTADQITEHGMTLRIGVHDTGIGIAADQIDRLFKPFSQADASASRKYGGTGLGLAISRQLAELMGGGICVKSEQRHGSSFCVTLKLALQPSSAARPRPGLLHANRLRVLVADDGPAQRDMLLLQLASWGVSAESVSDCVQAQHQLESAAAAARSFDVAILNADMAAAGIDLVGAIRNAPALRNIALIALVPLDSKLSLPDLIAKGFNARLTKPVRQSLLFDAISDAMVAITGRAPAANPDAAAKTPASPQTKFPGKRILLVEDNEVNQVVASEILARAGFRCDTVENGIKAIESAFANPYDVILMDCQMPDMDGYEATRRIRRRETEQRAANQSIEPIKIIALTANAIQGDRERCLAAGMNAYCPKPFKPRQLIDTIDNLLAPSAPAAPTPAPDLQPTFNIDELMERCGNDPATLRLVLDRFQQHAREDLDRMQQAINARDAAQLQLAAHSLKGAAGLLSAESVRRIAADLETIAEQSRLEDAPGSLEQLRRELQRCLADIPAILQRAAARTKAA